MADFKIQVERLTDQKERFEFEADARWWAERDVPSSEDLCEVERPFLFVLEASRTSDDILIEGEIEGQVGLECSRCARRYPHTFRDTYRLVLEPVKLNKPSDPEGERGLAENGICLGEDLEAGLYRGPVVRLDDFFGEVIALAMPIQPLCDEACPGICSHCGAERTSVPGEGCRCEDEKIESPFAVLAALKETSNES
jgi:uncharacterized protein